VCILREAGLRRTDLPELPANRPELWAREGNDDQAARARRSLIPCLFVIGRAAKPEPAIAWRSTSRERLGYDASVLATFSEWMLGLPSIIQVVVAFAVLMAIGLAPLVLWLGYAVATTRDAMQADRDRSNASSGSASQASA
jgi:hypothetical protein